ncbi:MAG TPA: VWA domain-containing protein [Acidobacteriota bacterium]|nr:VWA domain-containing protein [Acidobacteriota bacterium]
MLHFANPRLLLLLLAIPLLVWRYLRRMRQGQGSLRFSSTMVLEGIRSSWTVRFGYALWGIGILALALGILALARPQQGTQEEEVLTEGVDIVIALDASGSMAAEDFEPRNRFAVAKLVVGKFVEGLRHDRAGLVVFAAKAYTRCPLTLDYGALQTVLAGIELGTIEDGTAIGNALATSLNRLRESRAKSKVIILVTDGINNRGEIQPIDAAKIARALGVKIYTVGVGSSGMARIPVNDPVYGKIYADMKVEIDEDSLTQIAGLTKGLYYRATDRPSLERIFDDIGRLEKTKIKVKTYTHYNERFGDFLVPALVLALLGTIAGYTRFTKIP